LRVVVEQGQSSPWMQNNWVVGIRQVSQLIGEDNYFHGVAVNPSLMNGKKTLVDWRTSQQLI